MADTQPLDQTVSRPLSALKQGQVLAERYELIRFIANGGMGEVWEAEDRSLKERVALKTIRSDALNEETLERFRREVKLARKVSHRNVCRVFEFGEHRTEDGHSISFLTMELLVGTPLDAVLRQRGKLPPDEALPLLEQMAAALDAAHAEGIVHRDFKSPNVFIVQGTISSRVVVTDFGIARALSDDARVTVDPTQMIGTPGYMAPEQVEGSTVGPAADLYALGVVAFELVSGKLPFDAPTAMAMALMRLREPARRLADVEPGLDPKWDSAVATALARKPEDRFPNAAAFVAALRGSASAAHSRVVPPPRRNKATVVAGIALALLVALTALWAQHRSRSGLTRGGTLRVAINLPGGSIEPNSLMFTTSGLASAHIYEFLNEPGLLTSTVRGDDVLVRLTRPRVFHPHPCWPHGERRPATADDLAFSLSTEAGPTNWLNIPKVAIEGDAVVLPGVAHRQAVLGIWLDSLQLQPAMPADCATDAQSFTSGTGPFRLENPAEPDQVQLVRDDSNRSPDAHGPPYVDRITFVSAPSALNVVPQLRDGSLDIVEVPKNEWDDFFVDPHDRQPKLRPPFDALPVKVAAVQPYGTNITYLGIADTSGSPLRDPQLRRAIALGLDRTAIAKTRGANSEPLGRLLPTSVAGAAPVVSGALDHRPEEARKLIAETKTPIRPLVLACFHGQRSIADEVARQLEAVGIKVTVAELSSNVDLTAVDFFITIALVKPDPLELMLAATDPALAPKTHATVDRLVGMPYGARVKEYVEFERNVLEELPVIPLALSHSSAPSGFYLYRPEVHGFVDDETHQVLERFRLFHGVHLEPGDR